MPNLEHSVSEYKRVQEFSEALRGLKHRFSGLLMRSVGKAALGTLQSAVTAVPLAFSE